MSMATVGARYQIVIPLHERKKAGIMPHQKMHVTFDGERIILEPLGNIQLRGLLRETGPEYDAVDYVKKLRGEWEERQ